jgi:hypothetical protein
MTSVFFIIALLYNIISRVGAIPIFRGLFRPHPTSSVCAVAQYRKRLPTYFPEINAVQMENVPDKYSPANDAILDANDEPMEHGEVGWDSNRTVSRPVPRIPAVYLWSPSFTYRLFANRNSTQMREIEQTQIGTFAPIFGMRNYEDCEHPFFEEPVQIIFLFV